MLSAALPTSTAFIREHLRAPLTLVLLVAIPVFFVLIFASVLGDFAEALGGDPRQPVGDRDQRRLGRRLPLRRARLLPGHLLARRRPAPRRSPASARGVSRSPGSPPRWRSASRSARVAFVTLWLRSGIGHPLHAAVAIFTFAAIYIGIGALIGAFVKGPLEGSLLVVLVFSLDAFSGPADDQQRRVRPGRRRATPRTC